MKHIKLALTIDAEPDLPESGSTRWNIHKQKFSWNGIERGLDNLFSVLRNYQDSFGGNGAVTHFIRADEQIKAGCGAYNYMFKKYERLWKKLMHEGDEIGWHYHAFKWDGKNWIQETNDDSYLKKSMADSWEAIKSLKIQSSRMGWFFHNNTTMNALSDLGVNYDSSAIPGISMKNSRIKNFFRGTTFVCVNDWRKCPNRVYNPSREDYQTEGSLPIYEIPTTVAETKQFGVRKVVAPLSLLKDCRASLKKAIKSHEYLVAFLHLDDLLDQKFRRFYGIKIENLKVNLDFLKEHCDFEFVRVRDIV